MYSLLVTVDEKNFHIIPEEEAQHLAEELREDLHQFLTLIESWIPHILPAKQSDRNEIIKISLTNLILSWKF